jgi:hypothetical protein
MDATFREIDRLEKTKVEVEKTAEYRDLFAPLLLVAALLVAAEALLSQTLWRRLP